jgi:hypothetical protein
MHLEKSLCTAANSYLCRVPFEVCFAQRSHQDQEDSENGKSHIFKKMKFEIKSLLLSSGAGRRTRNEKHSELGTKRKEVMSFAVKQQFHQRADHS